MTLSSEQFHTLYDGAAQPVILVRDGAVAELNCHAQELFAVGTALRAYLPQDAALPEMLYARPAVLPVMAGGVCVSANTQPLDDALLLFLPPQDTRDELAAFCRAAQSISTPLTTLLSVSGTLFPLLSEAEDPAVQQNLAVLNRACYKLLRASENLTDLSYMQHGRLPLSLEKTDLTDFLDGLAQRADELCRQMGLALEVDLPQAPIFVWIDRRQVRRALLALLSLRTVLLLGPHTAALLPYPNFSAAGLAAIGDFARHGEVFFAVPLILCETGRCAALMSVILRVLPKRRS